MLSLEAATSANLCGRGNVPSFNAFSHEIGAHIVYVSNNLGNIIAEKE
jgi:hypothetical protein